MQAEGDMKILISAQNVDPKALVRLGENVAEYGEGDFARGMIADGFDDVAGLDTGFGGGRLGHDAPDDEFVEAGAFGANSEAALVGPCGVCVATIWREP